MRTRLTVVGSAALVSAGFMALAGCVETNAPIVSPPVEIPGIPPQPMEHTSAPVRQTDGTLSGVKYLGSDSGYPLIRGNIVVGDKVYTDGGIVQFIGIQPADHRFDLSREFVLVTGSFELLGEVSSKANARIEILGDTQVLFDGIVRSDENLAIRVDLTGVLRLDVIVTPSTENLTVLLADWEFLSG